LLTAPLIPVFFVWLALRGGIGRAALFAAGAVVGLGPAIWYLIATPHQFFFDVVGFHLYYRQAEWSGWFSHDLEVVTAWIDSGQGLVVVALALAGAVMGRKRPELQLCAWLAGTSCIYVSTTHPTFAQYFTVALPFAAILAAAALGELFKQYPQRWPGFALAGLMAAMLLRTLLQQGGNMSWADLTKVAQAVTDVLKPGEALDADEHIYLLTGRMPPPGMEWNSSHKIALPLAQAEPLHVLPQAELDKQIKAGHFAVVESCDEDEVKRLGLNDLYAKKKTIGSCFVFHDFKNR